MTSNSQSPVKKINDTWGPVASPIVLYTTWNTLSFPTTNKRTNEHRLLYVSSSTSTSTSSPSIPKSQTNWLLPKTQLLHPPSSIHHGLFEINESRVSGLIQSYYRVYCFFPDILNEFQNIEKCSAVPSFNFLLQIQLQFVCLRLVSLFKKCSR